MIIFDSSAVLALLKEEPGADIVADELDDSAISTANVAEVYGRAASYGVNKSAVDEVFKGRGLDIIPLSFKQARLAGLMMSTTSSAGLSLGDRCCLALASDLSKPVLTADRAWQQFAQPLDIEIRLIR